MSQAEGHVTLEDVIAVSTAKRVPVAPELAGYLALEIADATDAGAGDVDPRTVVLSDDGSVAVVRPRSGPMPGDAEISIRAILLRLLEATGAATPALLAAARRRPVAGFPALVEELEAALIPVNRAAGRRALARLVRETKRVPAAARHAQRARVPAVSGSFDDEAATLMKASTVEETNPPANVPTTERRTVRVPPTAGLPALEPAREPALVPAPERLFAGDEVENLLSSFEVSNASGERSVARDLKAMAGLSPTPPPPDGAAAAAATNTRTGPAANHAAAVAGDVERREATAEAASSLAAPLPPRGPDSRDKDIAPPVSLRVPRAEGSASRSAKARARPNEPPRPEEGSARSESVARDSYGLPPLGSREAPRAPKTGLVLSLLLLMGLVASGAAVWRYQPTFFTGRRAPSPSALASVSAAPLAAPRCKVSLAVVDAPANAEILLRMGQAPLDIERMPVGTRLEFVGTAEGHAPRRAMVRADVPWDTGPDGRPRIDVPVQLDPSKAKPGTLDPWPAAEPGTQVGGSGSPGTVHIVSNVRGAEIWLLAGLGPEARIEQLRCEGDIEVLVASGAILRKRLRVPEREILAAPDGPQNNKTITVSARP